MELRGNQKTFNWDVFDLGDAINDRDKEKSDENELVCKNVVSTSSKELGVSRLNTRMSPSACLCKKIKANQRHLSSKLRAESRNILAGKKSNLRESSAIAGNSEVKPPPIFQHELHIVPCNPYFFLASNSRPIQRKTVLQYLISIEPQGYVMNRKL